MRRFLDLNGPSVPILKAAGVFMLVIPALLYGCSALLGMFGITTLLLSMLMRGSILVGGAILVVLAGLIIVEQVQDHLFDRQYRRNRHKKIPVPGGRYECQYCGNQQVGEHDTHCAICGRRLS